MDFVRSSPTFPPRAAGDYHTPVHTKAEAWPGSRAGVVLAEKGG